MSKGQNGYFQYQIGENKTIRILQGDITNIEADALVNAANNHLWMGGGVAGAIKRKGGKIIETEAMRHGPIPIGEAVITTAGDLKARYIIHAAGMGSDLQTDEIKIQNATSNAIKRAHEAKVQSVAFPSIGTGVGGFPVKDAARVMIKTTLDFFQDIKDTDLKEIIFVLFDTKTYQTFVDELKSKI
jgi:O-acetyl-ADP-ribose deacetylase (regulator of RNase III)